MLPALMRRPLFGDEWLRGMQRGVDRLFHGMPNWLPEEEEPFTAAYPVDIHETEMTVEVEAELPGFTKEQVNVTFEEGMLAIVAERQAEKKPQGKQHLHERRFTRVERRFTLPAHVDENHVEAKLEGGVLKLTFRKTNEVTRPKIQVK